MNAIETAVSQYLAEQGVSFVAVALGQTKRDGWDCDEWRATLTKRAQSGGKMAELSQPFYTGLGHRKSKVRMPPDIARLGPRILARVEWENANLKPVAPSAASVLYSLLLDAQGAEQPFDYWASDYGYDTDSIKALNIYNACCEVRRQVNAFFSHEQREKLRELLEDF